MNSTVNPHRDVIAIRIYTGTDAEVIFGDAKEDVELAFPDRPRFMLGSPFLSNAAGALGYVCVMAEYGPVITNHFPWLVRKIISYSVVVDADISLFQTAVIAKIAEGWQPYNGAFVDAVTDKYVLGFVKYQGLIVV
jgi:hypothetical protein